MPYYISSGLKLFYEVTGRGEPVIFLHGFSLDCRMWQEQMAFFSQKFMVITADARGHGQSEAPESGYAREDRIGDILNLARHLNLKKFHMVGASMGGGDAIGFAVENQDWLYSLTLIGTVAAGWRPVRKFKDVVELAKKSGLDFARREYMKSSLAYYDKRFSNLKNNLEQMMLGFSGQPWLDPMKGKYPSRNDLRLLARLYIPVLIMVGQNDIVFRRLAEELHEKITSSQLHIIPGAGHMANMEMPELLNNILYDFILNIKQ